MALFLAPSAALADNECGIQIGTAHVVCDQTSYGDGVTYDAIGDLFIDFTASPTTEVESGGIDLSATGGDSISFDSASTNTEIESRETVGALLDVSTSSGDIDIQTEEMDADGQTPDNVTHAIRAVSGSGDISISAAGRVDVASDSNPSDSIGIEAQSDSGDINVTTMSFLSGNRYGIKAETGGSGDLTITVSGGTVSGDTAGIDATTGTGLLTINVLEDNLNNIGDSITGIHANSGGDAVINVGADRNVNGAAALDLTVAGEATVNNDGTISGNSFFGSNPAAIHASGGTLIINNDGVISNPLDLTGLTGGYTFNNNAGGRWSVGFSGLVSELGSGIINNAGTIDFGRNESVVHASDATLNGLPGSVLDMEMTLSSVGQTDCDAPIVAGCLDLTGGTTTGQTSVLVTSSAPPLDPAGGLTSAANPGILLVDVGGGTSAADHFVIDPDSENYAPNPMYGGVVTTGGPLVYALLYNPNSRQHILSSVPSAEGVEYVVFIDQALSVWHATADAVVGRQADLRGGATGGGWARLVNERTTRDAAPTMITHGNAFTYDLGYDLDTRAALFGFDAMTRENYIIGLHGGLISSDSNYDDTGNKNEIKGAAAGIYGGWWNESGLTVDAAVNGNFLKLDHDASYEKTHSDMRSMGIRAEAGWRVPIHDGFYVQPLATVTYVQASIKKMELRHNDLSFKNEESQRAALGVRLGGHFEMQSGITARYWLTGRAWEEYADDGNVQYATEADPLLIADDLSGSFEEVGFGASLSNKEDTLSVYASGGTKFIDEVTNYNFSIGARLRW